VGEGARVRSNANEVFNEQVQEQKDGLTLQTLLPSVELVGDEDSLRSNLGCLLILNMY